MSKTYVIQWKSKVNGRAGRGTKLFDLEEAEALVTELNAEYPDIHHEVAEAEPQTAPAQSEPGGGAGETPTLQGSPANRAPVLS